MSSNEGIKEEVNWNNESSEMDEEKLQKFMQIKSKSCDSLFGFNNVIKNTTNDNIDNKRKLILSPNEFQKQNNGVSVFKKKIKKEKPKKQSDYRKNICGYITKKIIREFMGTNFQQKVNKLCIKYGTDFSECRIFLLQQIQHITGPSHVYNLLSQTNGQQNKFKMTFRQFFEWFLKERYLRYLILQGKMDNKHAYIEYKNRYLLNLFPKRQTQQQKYTN